MIARVVTAVLMGCVATACGGSSSETPFPERPVDGELLKRHERALGDVPPTQRTTEQSALPQEPASNGSNTAAPANGQAPAEASPPDERPNPVRPVLQ